MRPHGRALAVARALDRRGRPEGACHGWRWRPCADYDDADTERRDLLRSIGAIERATGERPQGFFCRGSESRWTRGLLREAGLLYSSNGLDDDLPDWDAPPGERPLLVVPYAFDSNDMTLFHPNGFVRSDDMVDSVRDALDVLVREGEAGCPKLLNLGVHLRIVGRPGRFAAFRRILELIDGYGDALWVARRVDVARFWATRVPPPA